MMLMGVEGAGLWLSVVLGHIPVVGGVTDLIVIVWVEIVLRISDDLFLGVDLRQTTIGISSDDCFLFDHLEMLHNLL